MKTKTIKMARCYLNVFEEFKLSKELYVDSEEAENQEYHFLGFPEKINGVEQWHEIEVPIED